MPGPPLAKSRPKSDLMVRLNLTGEIGEEIYNLLYVRRFEMCERFSLPVRKQDEAVVGRKNLSEDYNALTEYSRNKRVQQPYRWDDLQETYRHRERMSIVARAGPRTRLYYQEGQYGTTVVDNWVADWFLWHSFRFRDNRTTIDPPRGVTTTHNSSARGKTIQQKWFPEMIAWLSVV